MNIYKICTLFIFYKEFVKFLIGPKLLVIGPFRFLRSNIYFKILDNLVRALSWLFEVVSEVRTEDNWFLIKNLALQTNEIKI